MVAVRQVTRFGLFALGMALLGLFGCSATDAGGGETTLASTHDALAGLSSANLQLQELTNSCGANQAQQFFQLTNAGTTSVKLSDIQIKFWVDDTSASSLVAAFVSTPGCVSNPGNPSCVHPVPNTKATISATKFSPACGPDANHQANTEVTIGSTDTYAIPAGGLWSNIQVALRLANGANFSPGTSKWYSPCLAGTSYKNDSHFAVYYQGNLVFSSGITAPDCRAPHGGQTLSRYVSAAAAAAPLVGPVPATTPVTIAFSLPVRNEPVLNNLLAQVSNPSSPNYRHYLSPADFAANFGPTLSDYQALTSWAQAAGLTVRASYPNHLQLDVSGPASKVEQLLLTNLNYYRRSDGTQFMAPDRAPTTTPPVPLFDVVGLSNFERTTTVGYGSGHISGADFRAAYAYDATDSTCPSTTQLLGDGQCIGIVGTRFDPVDINTFVADSPPLGSLVPGTGASVTALGVDGYVTSAAVSGDIWTWEIESDIEMAVSMAPHAEVVVYEQDLVPGSSTQSRFESIFAAMASDAQHPLCNQLTTSYIGWTPTDTAVRYFQQVFPAQGQTFFRATGDDGVDPTACSNCAGDRTMYNYMTMVGGTVLTKNTDGTFAEKAWGPGLSGVWSDVTIPDYQASANLGANGSGASATNRNVVDVAAEANIDVTVVVTDDVPDAALCKPATPPVLQSGVVESFGGCSLASPLWAGFMALVNQQNQALGRKSVGFFNPTLYAIGNSSAYASSFYDIGAAGQATSYGEVGTWKPDPAGCISSIWTPTSQPNPTKPGYDLPTGWGSPRCGLLHQLTSSTPAPNRAIAVGTEHGCAVRADNTIDCWGNDDSGQMGNANATNPQLTAINVTGLPTGLTVKSLVAGAAHTCVLYTDGSVWCWGSNGNGELGVDDTNAHGPVNVTGFAGAVQITGGSGYTCALFADGTMKCTGENFNGQFGNGTTTSTTTPVPAGPSGVKSMVAGESFTCAVVGSDAHAECWGSHLGEIFNDLTPLPIKDSGGNVITGVAAVAPGAVRACMIMQDTTAKCWGENLYGEIGDGSAGSNVAFPTTVVRSCTDSSPLTGIVAMAVNSDHTCALLSNGTVDCWGDGSAGGLADGSNTPRYCPAPVPSLAHVTSLLGAHDFTPTCALTAQGVSCWGTEDLTLVPEPIQFF